jgi:hypothetical protein
MVRVIVCSGALIALIVGVRFGLHDTFESLGFGWGATACVAVMLLSLLTAYLIDRADSRSQEVLPPTPPDYR